MPVLCLLGFVASPQLTMSAWVGSTGGLLQQLLQLG
jgi:hypothetical protein